MNKLRNLPAWKGVNMSNMSQTPIAQDAIVGCAVPLVLKDNFGRSFPYLRLSITDICNFSCDYCLPNGYKACAKSSFLSLDEIARLVEMFTQMGTRKIRKTMAERQSEEVTFLFLKTQ